MKYGFAVIVLTLGSALSSALSADLDTGVISEKSAEVLEFAWGTLYRYFDGESVPSENTLAAVAVINPGKEIHPPHKHLEEEFLMVIEGSGSWSVRGESSEARPGDILYAAPWEMHGIRNSGDTHMKLLIIKWGHAPEPAD